MQGKFDRVASIEMFEAVGERFWPTYFDKIRDVLAPGGRAGLQIITIQDELFDEYDARTDFIQKYVFPGGCLPSEARMAPDISGAGLVEAGTVRFGGDYAEIYPAYRHVMARDPGAKVHMYGKGVRPGRKISHVNVSGPDLADARARAQHAADYLQ